MQIVLIIADHHRAQRGECTLGEGERADRQTDRQ